MVSVARENTRRYLVSSSPSLDEIGFRWPPNVFRYSFLIGSLRSTLDLPPPPAIALHFFENVFSHLSFLSFFF